MKLLATSCPLCSQGTLQETRPQDSFEGSLHCTHCGIEAPAQLDEVADLRHPVSALHALRTKAEATTATREQFSDVLGAFSREIIALHRQIAQVEHRRDLVLEQWEALRDQEIKLSRQIDFFSLIASAPEPSLP